MADKPIILLRRGKKEHIENLYNNGELYINTFDAIREYDSNLDRSDSLDCVSHYIGDAYIEICDKDISSDAAHIVEVEDLVFDNNKKGNIYCFYGIYSDQLMSNTNIDIIDISSFGEYLIVIFKPEVFLKRVKDELEKHNYHKVYDRKVEYVSNKYVGYMGPFRKKEIFSLQSEYRIFVVIEKNDKIKNISIGSLHDIAFIKKSCQLKFVFNGGKEKRLIIP